MNLFKKLFKNKKVIEEKFMVTEGVAGLWHYHISLKESFTKSLCGKQVMNSSIPLSAWGHKVDHIPMHYCEECRDLHCKSTKMTIL